MKKMNYKYPSHTNIQTLANNKHYYMTSDNVLPDWPTSLLTFFDKTLYSPHPT